VIGSSSSSSRSPNARKETPSRHDAATTGDSPYWFRSDGDVIGRQQGGGDVTSPSSGPADLRGFWVIFDERQNLLFFPFSPLPLSSFSDVISRQSMG